VLSEYWSGRVDLNHRPHGPEPCALPGCATPRLWGKCYSRCGVRTQTDPDQARESESIHARVDWRPSDLARRRLGRMAWRRPACRWRRTTGQRSRTVCAAPRRAKALYSRCASNLNGASSALAGTGGKTGHQMMPRFPEVDRVSVAFGSSHRERPGSSSCRSDR
jgi:hypothetical protein